MYRRMELSSCHSAAQKSLPKWNIYYFRWISLSFIYILELKLESSYGESLNIQAPSMACPNPIIQSVHRQSNAVSISRNRNDQQILKRLLTVLSMKEKKFEVA